YDDDLDEFESDTDDAYNDPFDSKEEKINESKLLIDGLDLPRSSDFLPSPKYDSFFFEDFSKVDALPSTNNEDKVFNPTTSSSSPNHLLEEFVDELALITFPPRYDDLPFDIESDLKEIEYFLNHDPINKMDYILKDLIDESNLVDPNDNLFDTIPEMFTDEHALDYSSP
nr:hypothetical protein [Tanacetum cinerariifolium]